jgi:hypothetical protein
MWPNHAVIIGEKKVRLTKEKMISGVKKNKPTSSPDIM